MKRIFVVTLVFASLLGAASALAVTNSRTCPVSVSVGAVESISCTVSKCTNSSCSSSVPNQTSMDFGQLTNSDPNNSSSALMSSVFYRVYCGVNTSGRPFTLTQTGTALSCTAGACVGTGATIPDNAWVFTPGATVDTTDLDDLANETPPSGTIIGTKKTANSTNAAWIDTGTNRNIVTAFADYAVAAPPNMVDNSSTAPSIPPNQTAGTYAAGVYWTVTAK